MSKHRIAAAIALSALLSFAHAGSSTDGQTYANFGLDLTRLNQ